MAIKGRGRQTLQTHVGVVALRLTVIEALLLLGGRHFARILRAHALHVCMATAAQHVAGVLQSGGLL